MVIFVNGLPSESKVYSPLLSFTIFTTFFGSMSLSFVFSPLGLLSSSFLQPVSTNEAARIQEKHNAS